jgi:PAS domain-containing protein
MQSRLEQELRLTRAFTLGIARAEDVEGGLRSVLGMICDETGWDLGQAWVYDPDSDRQEPGPSTHGTGAPPLESGLLALTAEWDAPLGSEDLAADSDDLRVRAAAEAGLGAAFAVPVLTDGRAVATLQFFARERRPTDEALLEVLCAIAAQLGSVVEGKRAETELRDSWLRFRAVAETAGDALVSTDDSGTIVYANPAAHRTFGWDENELVGPAGFEASATT